MILAKVQGSTRDVLIVGLTLTDLAELIKERTIILSNQSHPIEALPKNVEVHLVAGESELAIKRRLEADGFDFNSSPFYIDPPKPLR